MEYVDAARLWATVEGDQARYRQAEPFPHIVIDGFLKDEVAGALEAQFPKVDHKLWKHHLHFNSHKFACNRIEAMPALFQAVLRELNSKELLGYLQALTGIPDLIEDDELEGGGLHQIVPGGFLKVHADFNYHPSTGHHRRINLLVYLNREWDEGWDGNLELWSHDMSRCAKSIAPVLNRCVVFSTTDFAYHGHPRPLSCPPGRSRKSLALYYYTVVRPTEETSRPHSTLYKRTPVESPSLHQLRLLRRYLLSRSSIQLLRSASRRLRGR
jgi:Rps23 Pro-64 3,4-dihydroxylase Tpa1-like proline 4-hydroxylase